MKRFLLALVGLVVLGLVGTVNAQVAPPPQTAQLYAAEIRSAVGSDIVDNPVPGTIKITIKGRTTGIDPHTPESTYLRFLHYAPAGTENWSEFAMNKTDQEAPAAHLNQPVEASLIANLPPDPNFPFDWTSSKSFRVKLTLKEYSLGQFNQASWIIREVDLGTVTITKTWRPLGGNFITVSYDGTPPAPPAPAPDPAP